MLIHTEIQQGFTIEFHALEEHLSLSELYSEPEDIIETQKALDNFDLFLFCAEVRVLKNGIKLNSQYLGACIYPDYINFIEEDDYYTDMKERAIDEAKVAIKNLMEG